MTSPQNRAPFSIPPLLFFGSGFGAFVLTALSIYYVEHVLGSTAETRANVLAAFFLAHATGALSASIWSARAERPLRLYALAITALALYGASFPLLLPMFRELYLGLAPSIHESSQAARGAARFGFGLLALGLPAFLTGVSTPTLLHGAKRGGLVARLALGASLGAWTSAYVLVPALGLLGSMWLVVLIHLVLAFLAYRHAAPVRLEGEARRAFDEPEIEAPPIAWNKLVPVFGLVGLVLTIVFFRSMLAFVLQRPTTVALVSGASLGALLLARRGISLRPSFHFFLFLAFVNGYLVCGLGFVWTHLFAVFGERPIPMWGAALAALFLAVACGALLFSSGRPRYWIGFALALGGISVLLGMDAWDRIPAFLAASSDRDVIELGRHIIALGILLLPAVSLGLHLVLTLHAATQGSWDVGRLGKAHAALALGAALGAWTFPSLFIPELGSVRTLELFGALLLFAGAIGIYVLANIPRRRLLAAVALSGVFWAPLFPASWEIQTQNVAALMAVPHPASEPSKELFRAEDVNGGLIRVIEARGVKTIFANDRVVGDDAGARRGKHRAAHTATLLTAGRERALLIGVGSGVMLNALAAHGFEEIVCTETSAARIAAAGGAFAEANRDVLNRPELVLLKETARNVLMESADRYDVIAVEAGSAGSFFHRRELYALAASRLRRQGVLLSPLSAKAPSARQLLLVVRTARSVFPHVSLWMADGQAFIVSSNEPLRVDLEALRSDRARAEMGPYLDELASGSPLELLDGLVVTDDDMDRFDDALSALSHLGRAELASDDRPIAHEPDEPGPYVQSRRVFRPFRSSRPIPFRGEPSRFEKALAQAAFTRGWDDPRAVPSLSRLWSDEPTISDAASFWLLDELSSSVRELHAELDTLGDLLGRADGDTQCQPIPRLVSHADHVPLSVIGSSGASLDGTQPRGALDSIFDPALGKGWTARPEGRAVFLDVALEKPLMLHTVYVVARAIDGAAIRVRLLGRDRSGAWHPLASGGDVLCMGVRRVRVSEDVPALTTLRVEIQGETIAARVALHELWVEAS
ncbi:MAG: hypothetical protein E2P02_06455 [Acidobacteria bacterium]|nr:MAG: hypothetical protein E2P02_06455 [Acidobacteriota bacterium]